MTGFRPGTGPGDELALDDRHPFGGQLHPQVAAGHHDPVGSLDDGVDVVEGLGALDLGDEPDVPAGRDQGPQLLHVRGAADEGEGEEVDAHGEHRGGVVPVLVGQARRRKGDIGKVDALAVRQHAAVDDGAMHIGTGHGIDAQLEEPVGQEHPAPGPHVSWERLVLGGDQSLPADHRAARDRDPAPRLQHDAAAIEAADPDLRTTEVGQHGHGCARRPGLLPNEPVGRGVAFPVAMGHVQAEHVDAGGDEPGDGRPVGARRPERGDDLGPPALERGAARRLHDRRLHEPQSAPRASRRLGARCTHAGRLVRA